MNTNTINSIAAHAYPASAAAQNDHNSALRFITCGSVDDGKSTLIGRLLVDSRAVLQDHIAGVTRSGEVDLALLTDGLSAEREQGINSGAAVGEALREEGYRVTEIDVDRNVAAQLEAINPDVCFNALHGKFGEDGCVQGVLEMLAIPYTHSGVLASALAMHKERAKDIMKLAGVAVAEAKLVTRREAAEAHVLPPPYVVKPPIAASGVGVVIVPMSLAHLHHRKDAAHRPLADGPTSSIALAWPAAPATASDAASGAFVETFIGIVRGRTANSSR